jgi:metal-dependent amidase/aminoacylase/carboxypeptidase family protein
MTAEDFAFISRKIPSCFFRLGVANPEKGIQAPVHTPDFDVDENCLYYGSLLLSSMAVHILS